MRQICFMIISLMLGCESSESSEKFKWPSKPYSVGTTTFYIESAGRTLPIQLWYPSRQAEVSVGIEQLEVGEHKEMIKLLIDMLDNDCPRIQTQIAINATSFLSPEPRPVIIFSHCHSCTRFSSFSTAELLAQQGYIVAAPDHVGDTLYDELSGLPAELNSEVLQMRANDISRVLDAVLSDHPDLPKDLSPNVDKIGIFGHSFGAVTTGFILQTDDRFTGGVAIAAPIENPLIPGALVEAQPHPILYLVAKEDNSITEFGNRLIRQNYEQHPVEAWKLEVQDAGHWSFSDLCGLTASLMPGCGTAPRQTNNNEMVTYIDNQRGREIAAETVLKFFDYHFNGDLTALQHLDNGLNDLLVESVHRNQVDVVK